MHLRRVGQLGVHRLLGRSPAWRTDGSARTSSHPVRWRRLVPGHGAGAVDHPAPRPQAGDLPHQQRRIHDRTRLSRQDRDLQRYRQLVLCRPAQDVSSRHLRAIVHRQDRQRPAGCSQRAERYDDLRRIHHGPVRRSRTGHEQQQQGRRPRLRASRPARPRESAASGSLIEGLIRPGQGIERQATMAKFANVVTIEVAPGRRDQFLPLLVSHQARSLKDEPGTLQFEILLPKDDDTKVLSYEVYRGDAAFEVHRNGWSLAKLREEMAGMVVKLQGVRCAVVDWRSTNAPYTTT